MTGHDMNDGKVSHGDVTFVPNAARQPMIVQKHSQGNSTMKSNYEHDTLIQFNFYT